MTILEPRANTNNYVNDGQNVWIPVIAVFLAITIAVGTFCRWRGMRRRRQLDMLERLEREDDDMEGRFVEYGEKPTMFDASMGQSSSCSGRWPSVMVSVHQTISTLVRRSSLTLKFQPVSVWYNNFPELVTESTAPNHWMLSRLASEEVAEFQRQVQRLRKRMNGHREEDSPVDDLKPGLLSTAFLVRMPSAERNEYGVLPDLVLAIQDVPVTK